MASVLQQPAASHPHGFLLHNSTHHSQPVAVPQSTPVAKPPPPDPFYGHEELARICARFIRHVFNCPSEQSSQPHVANAKPTESTVTLPRFIAYAFHRTRLPSAVAFHSLYLLHRLKARYPGASCAYGHRLFLTSYMLSSKVICDDTYSNKSWAIVGQGFYDLRDVNLMEREMIHYLSWDLTISGEDLKVFTDKVKDTYRRGCPRTPYVVIPDTSREKDSFGKGTLERETGIKNLPGPVPLESTASPSEFTDPPPSYPGHDDPESPYSDSSSSSSRESSPPSPGLKTPPDEGVSAPGTPGGKPVRIEYIDSIDFKPKIHGDRERPLGWAMPSTW